MKKIQEIIMKDLGWKLFSVAIAATMWFMVINISQPIDTRTYSKKITLENLDSLTDKGITIKNIDSIAQTKIGVKIKGQRTSLDRLNQSLDWLYVTLDLSVLETASVGDVIAVPVSVGVKEIYSGNNYNIISKSPSMINVEIDTLVTKMLPIKIAIEGSVANGTMYSAPKLGETEVRISGASSVVDQVVTVKGGIKGQDVNEKVELSSELVAYDASGEVVRGVSLSPEYVGVRFHSVTEKEVPIYIDIVDLPEERYDIGSITITPQTIEIRGSTTTLAGITEIRLPEISVSERTSNIIKRVDIMEYLPKGVTLVDLENNVIEVVVSILSDEAKDLMILPEQIDILSQEEDEIYTILEGAQVRIEGRKEVLDTIDELQIKGTVDVGGLDVGEHNVLLNLELPERITSGIIYVTVKIEEQKISPEIPEIEEPIEEDTQEDTQEDTVNPEEIDPDIGSPEPEE